MFSSVFRTKVRKSQPGEIRLISINNVLLLKSIHIQWKKLRRAKPGLDFTPNKYDLSKDYQPYIYSICLFVRMRLVFKPLVCLLAYYFLCEQIGVYEINNFSVYSAISLRITSATGEIIYMYMQGVCRRQVVPCTKLRFRVYSLGLPC